MHVYVTRRGKKEEITPHPKTRRYLVREEARDDATTAESVGNQQNQIDESGYEFLPVFKSEGKAAAVKGEDSDVEYDIPQDVLTGLPTSTSPHVPPEYECVDPAPQQPPSKSQKKNKKARKPTYISMDKVSGGKTTTNPPTVPGGESKFESPWNEVRVPSKVQNIAAASNKPSSKKAPLPSAQKGRKVQPGVGVAPAEPPQAIARKEEVEEEEGEGEGGEFEAMRARLANKKGAKINEGQSSTRPKM